MYQEVHASLYKGSGSLLVEQARGSRFKRLHLQPVVMWWLVPGPIASMKDMSAMTHLLWLRCHGWLWGEGGGMAAA